MRISDWSSDVCSSDLASGSSSGQCQGAAGNASGQARCPSRGDQGKHQGHQGSHEGKSRGAAGNASGLSRQSEGLRQHIGPCGCGAQFRSEEHTSELQSLMRISYAVFCLKKKIKKNRKEKTYIHNTKQIYSAE